LTNLKNVSEEIEIKITLDFDQLNQSKLEIGLLFSD